MKMKKETKDTIVMVVLAAAIALPFLYLATKIPNLKQL